MDKIELAAVMPDAGGHRKLWRCSSRRRLPLSYGRLHEILRANGRRPEGNRAMFRRHWWGEPEWRKASACEVYGFRIVALWRTAIVSCAGQVDRLPSAL
jgi:hypothetical protein